MAITWMILSAVAVSFASSPMWGFAAFFALATVYDAIALALKDIRIDLRKIK